MLGIHTKPSLYRDFALLSVLIVFILFLVSVWVSYETFEDHAKSVIKQLENEAVRIDRALIIEIERTSYLLESVARQMRYSGTTSDNITNLFTSFEKKDGDKKSGFFWADSNQEIVLSAHQGEVEKPVSVSDRDYMKKAITAPWKVHIGHPIRGRVSEKWVMPLAIGLTDDDGHFLGAVIYSLDVGSFNRELQNVIKQDGISFAITNLAFTLLTEQANEPNFFGTYFSLPRLAKINFNTSTNGVYSQGHLLRAGDIFSYYEKSSEYPYIIFVGYDPDRHSANVRAILLPRLLQILVITLFLISVLWTVRRRIIQPVITLTDRTSEIVRGKRFYVSSDDGPEEIAHLAREISRMAGFIEECKRIEGELRSKNNELLHIKESAEMSNSIKAQFFEEVGESLTKPIATLSDYIEGLADEIHGPMEDAYQPVIRAMKQQIQEANDLLNDILSISRAEGGLLALSSTKVDLAFILQKCIRILHERTRFENIEVIQSIADELPDIQGDELRLKQLILNLLMGAAGQIKTGDSIRVAISAPKNVITLRLEYVVPEPEGPSHELSHSSFFSTISEPEEEAPVTTQGLGLALSRLIVAMHAGKLDVKTTPDRSVIITVTFPEDRAIKMFENRAMDMLQGEDDDD
ncbi:MAG: hypothetical protein MRY32_06655 [Rickettsiales bacterium]|nr:hypothetical protein [Rickettsiales bacterium]